MDWYSKTNTVLLGKLFTDKENFLNHFYKGKFK